MFDTSIPLNTIQGSYATLDEIKAQGRPVNYQTAYAAASGVTMMSDCKTAYVCEDDGFYLVVGGTGSKKTRNVVAPYIYNNALAGKSMVISDVKGDLYKMLSKMLNGLGYKIRILNFNDPSKGDAYNPLSEIYKNYKGGNKHKANRDLNSLADGIFDSVKSDEDPFWHTSSANYFVGSAMTLFDLFDIDKATIANVFNLHIQGNVTECGESLIKEYYKDKETLDAWKLLVTTVEAPKETKASIHSVYTTALNKMLGQNESLMKMMSHSTFKIGDIVNEKTAVFIIANEESISVYGGLISAYIQQWYASLVDIAEETNGTLNTEVVFVLDEFGNLPAILDFQTKISLSRARGISWMVVLQSFSQLEYRYGKDVASTIIGNTTNWVYLFSPDPQLLEYISRLLGDVTDEYTGRTRRLLSPNQLRHFQKCNEDGLTECLMLLGRMKPFVSYLPDISQYFGIEILNTLDISTRKDNELLIINFKEAIENKKREQLEQEKKEKEQIVQDLKSEIDTLKQGDPHNLTEIIDRIIVEIKERSGVNE